MSVLSPDGPPASVRSGKFREESPRRMFRNGRSIEYSLQREGSRMQDLGGASRFPGQGLGRGRTEAETSHRQSCPTSTHLEFGGKVAGAMVQLLCGRAESFRTL